MLAIRNHHDGRTYYASVIKRRKTLTVRDKLAGDLVFDFKYEAAIWKKSPIPFLSKPFFIVDIDDGTREPSMSKAEFSTLIELVLRNESVDTLFEWGVAFSVFSKFDVLATTNVVREYLFLRRVRQIALLIRPDHADNVRAILGNSATSKSI